MTSQRNTHASPEAALAAWQSNGFVVRAVVELPTYQALYAWGILDGADRLVEFTPRYISISDERGCPLPAPAVPTRLAPHHAMRAGDDGD